MEPAREPAEAAKEIKSVDEITSTGDNVKLFMAIMAAAHKVSPLEVLHAAVLASGSKLDMTVRHNQLLVDVYNSHKEDFDRMFMIMGYCRLADNSWVVLAAPEAQVQNDNFSRAARRMARK